jgi:H+/gluconate symporter-like permease
MLTVDNGDLFYASVGLALLIGLVVGVIVTVAVVLIEGRFREKRRRFLNDKEHKK